MRVRLTILLFIAILLKSAFSHDRFFPGRFEISPKDNYFTHSTFLRTLAETSESYQTKIESSNVTSDIVTTRLRGDTELGYYYITLFFGTPLQKQTLIVDTGSVTTTIPCIECGANCGTNHFDKPFDHGVSESFKTFSCLEKFGNYVCNDCTNECSFSVAYVEGSSYSGHFKKDIVALGNEIEDLFDILLNKTTVQGNGRLMQEADSPASSSESTIEPATTDNSENNEQVSQSSGDTQNAENSNAADQKQDGSAAETNTGEPATNPETTSNPTVNSEDTAQSQDQETSTSSTSPDNSTDTPSPAAEEASTSSTNTTEAANPTNTSNLEAPEAPDNSTNPEGEQKATDFNETNSSGQVVEDNSSNNTLTSQEPMQNNTSNNSETTTDSANSTNTTNAQNSENNTSSESSTNTTETQTSNNTSSSNSTTTTGIEAPQSIPSSENTTNTTTSDTNSGNTEPSSPKDLTDEEKSYQKNKDLVEGVVLKRKTFMPFGCTERETKLFFNQEADGILGLGVKTDTNGSPPNLIDVMHQNNPHIKNAFSLCLAQSGGYLTTGGYNFAYHKDNEKIYYTEFYDNYGQYRVYLNKIEVAGKSIGLSADTLNHGEGAFFDSGTTLTHVPTQTYNAIKSGLYEYCSENSERCGRRVLTEAFCYIYDPKIHPTLSGFLKSFPTFTFYFGNKGEAKYEWKGEDYLARKGEAGKYCMGISRYERETILGGTFMKNHDIMFDKENKKIAFVRAECGAVVDVTSPIYLYSTKADQTKVETPSTGVEDNRSVPNIGTTPAEGFDKEDDTNNGSTSNVSVTWNQMKKYVVFTIVGAAVGIIIFAAVKYLRRKRYAHMRNEIEIADNRAIGLSFESNTGNLPSPGEKPEGGNIGTINSLVEVSI